MRKVSVQVKMSKLKFSILIFLIFVITSSCCGCESNLKCDQDVNLDDECEAEQNLNNNTKQDKPESDGILNLHSHIRMQKEKIAELESKIKAIEDEIGNFLGVAKILGKSSKIFWESLEFRFRILPCLRTKICFTVPATFC